MAVAPAIPADNGIIGVTAGTLPLQAGSIDTVLSTYTLCTIPGPVKALRETRHVPALGGRLLFASTGARPTKACDAGEAG